MKSSTVWDREKSSDRSCLKNEKSGIIKGKFDIHGLLVILLDVDDHLAYHFDLRLINESSNTSFREKQEAFASAGERSTLVVPGLG